jgi:hypothetical protein
VRAYNNMRHSVMQSEVWMSFQGVESPRAVACTRMNPHICVHTCMYVRTQNSSVMLHILALKHTCLRMHVCVYARNIRFARGTCLNSTTLACPCMYA